MKIVIISALLAAAFASEYPAYPKSSYPPAAYAYGNKPFEYEWVVEDSETGNHFSHQANSDGTITSGLYRTVLPDGRTQTVTYKADHYGYVADVAYDGEARYDEYKPARKAYQAYPKTSYPTPYYPKVSYPSPTYQNYPAYPTYSKPVYPEYSKPSYSVPVYPAYSKPSNYVPVYTPIKLKSYVAQATQAPMTKEKESIIQEAEPAVQEAEPVAQEKELAVAVVEPIAEETVEMTV